MKRDSRPSYFRLLARVTGLVGRMAPLPLLALLAVQPVFIGTEVLVYHRLERVLTGLTGERWDEIAGAIVAAGVVMLARELLEVVSNLVTAHLAGRAIGVLTETLNRKAARLELLDFESLDANERMELARTGPDGAFRMLAAFLSPIAMLALLAAAEIYLHSLAPPLALVVPCVFVPRIASHLVRGSRYYRLERRTVPLLREFQYLERCLTEREYFKETRVLGAGSRLLRRYRKVLSRFNVARWHEDLRVGLIDLGLGVLMVLGYGGSFVLAALLLANGSVGVGGFAVVIYAMSWFMLMTEAIMEGFGGSYRQSVQASHLVEFLDRDEGRPVGDRAGRGTGGAVTARNVSFIYPGTDAAAVDGVSVDLTPGTTVALVGANGAGKTTLAKLLLGLFVPTSGDVIRGTVNTRDATRQDIRERTSAVFQNFQRYRMTLRENVVLADVTRAEDEQAVLRALERGGVPAELWQGREGLDLMLSREFGTRDLSLGQWQRVAIARGLFREHDVILLDEPTASIDPLEEQAVYERFMEIAAGRTAILVTHRLGSARLADRILVMRDGRIVEDGTHERLLERRGLYYEMFTAQAAWYERGR